MKIVFVDGNLNSGQVRSIRGKIIRETNTMITIQRNDGIIELGRQFIIKIENWS